MNSSHKQVLKMGLSYLSIVQHDAVTISTMTTKRGTAKHSDSHLCRLDDVNPQIQYHDCILCDSERDPGFRQPERMPRVGNS